MLEKNKNRNMYTKDSDMNMKEWSLWYGVRAWRTQAYGRNWWTLYGAGHCTQCLPHAAVLSPLDTEGNTQQITNGTGPTAKQPKGTKLKQLEATNIHKQYITISCQKHRNITLKKRHNTVPKTSES